MEREDVDASNVLGPFFVGYTFSVILLGVLAIQAFLYYIKYGTDKSWVKTYVAGLCVMNILNSSIDLAYIYRTLIKSFGDQNALEATDWYIAVDPILNVIIVLMCQCFFAHRVRELTGQSRYPILIMTMGVLSAVGGIWDGQKLAQISNFKHLLDTKIPMIVWIIPGLIADGLIAAVHFGYLEEFPRDVAPYDRFLRGFVQTGLVLPVTAFVGMILYVTSQRTGLYMIFSLPLPKVYSAVLMCCLNTRTGWKFEGYMNESTYTEHEEILKPGEILEFAAPPLTDTTF